MWTTDVQAPFRDTIVGMSEQFFDDVLYYDGLCGQVVEWDRWWRTRPIGAQPLATAARQGFVVGAGQLAGLGVSRSRARTALRRGEWFGPGYGCVAPLLVDGEDAEPELVARRRHALTATAAALRHPRHVPAARSAAILHGLPTLALPDTPELLSYRDAGLGRQATIHAFGAALGPDEITTWFGAPVTTPARTLVDLARHDRRDAIMAADAALHDRLTTAGQIERALAGARGWPGVRQARAVLALADPRAESPLESLVRLSLHDDGFPTPELQYWIGPDRVDFCWPAARLVLEADGRAKYVGDALWLEKKRGVRITRLGWAIERVLWSDLGAAWPLFAAGLRHYF